MKTTITLSHMQAFCLAEVFADQVHAAVISLHNEAVNKLSGRPSSWPVRNSSFWEMQDAIRSISDPHARRDFVQNIRYHFIKLREERCTDPTTRAYIAKVLAYRRAEAERQSLDIAA